MALIQEKFLKERLASALNELSLDSRNEMQLSYIPDVLHQYNLPNKRSDSPDHQNHPIYQSGNIEKRFDL